MTLTAGTLEQALQTLGELLDDRGHPAEVVAIGGGSLLLTGFIERPTKDLDLVAIVEDGEYTTAKPLPDHLAAAAKDVAAALGLADYWFNGGPTELLDLGLPKGFASRVETRTYGALTIHIAGRFDQICFKLYAAVDQGPDSKHFADLERLQPSG
ncbi:MAG: hypothetical protein V3T05_09040 [Myxococcota bacterium]